MPTYISLSSWTEQGRRAINESPRRLDAAKKMLQEIGGQMLAFYMTMGEYDFVFVYEAPDDAVAARFSLKGGQGGNVRGMTMKAFAEPAYREIIASLG